MVPDDSVDLCYIDPPFFSNRQYEVIWGNGYEKRSFKDRFEGGVEQYVSWMEDRVRLVHQKLKTTGSLFLQCDWHANNRLRYMLDKVFGTLNFTNEITYKRTKSIKNNGGQGKLSFDVSTDTIYLYSKSSNSNFHQSYSSYRENYISKMYKFVDEATGRRYRLDNLAGPGGASKGNPKYMVMGVERYWRYSQETMNGLIAQGLVVQRRPGAVPAFRRFLDAGKGVPAQSLWDDLSFAPNESLGYPTQKPKSLIRRILETASDPGDTVLDCFAGGGVTAKVAAEMQRRFIIGNVSSVAIRVTVERLKRDMPIVPFFIENMPQTVTAYRSLDGHTFAERICEFMGWRVNQRKSGDGGIDGWDGVGAPVQIKNQIGITGRHDIQKFVGALATWNDARGIFVSWEFSKQAVEYCAVIRNEKNIEVRLMPCAEVLDSVLISDDKASELESYYEDRIPKSWRDPQVLSLSGTVLRYTNEANSLDGLVEPISTKRERAVKTRRP